MNKVRDIFWNLITSDFATFYIHFYSFQIFYIKDAFLL